MLQFYDLNGTKVELAFRNDQHPIEPRHVLVVLKHEEKWLLTRHRERGIEFPGGKAEEGETIEAAAIRETFEETGVRIHRLQSIAEYVVHSTPPFCKAVFTAEVDSIDASAPLYETEGAYWLTSEELDRCQTLSFHMIGTGMEELRKRVEMNGA